MCGIVGIYLKNEDLYPELGGFLAAMLVEMSDRGPDSAGIALYRDPVPDSSCKLTLHAAGEYDWDALRTEMASRLKSDVKLDVLASHAVVIASAQVASVQDWLRTQHPELRIMSAGSAIEIYKEKGPPREFVRQFRLHELNGSHALGHTRMATESAVTTEHSHPFSTGMDLCLVQTVRCPTITGCAGLCVTKAWTSKLTTTAKWLPAILCGVCARGTRWKML